MTTPSVPEQPSEAPALRAAKRDLRIALLASLVPVFSFPVVLGLAVVNWRRSRGHEQARRWARGVAALAAVDALVVALTVVGSVYLPDNSNSLADAEERPADPLVIGVMLHPQDSGIGNRVRFVVPTEPADRAGIREGDVIVAVDATPTANIREIVAALQLQSDGVSRKLAVSRGGQALRLDVVPMRASTRSSGNWSVVRPDALEPGTRDGMTAPTRRETLTFAGFLVALLALAFVGRSRCRAPGMFLVGVGAAVVVDVVVIYGGLHVATLAIGPEHAGHLFVTLLAAGCAAGLLVAWLACRKLASGGALFGVLEPRLGTRVAVLDGACLGIGSLRLGHVVLMVTALVAHAAAVQPPADTNPVELIVHLSGGETDRVAVFVVVALLGPLFEEVVFRGVLLPWLATWTSVATAVVVSSVLFAVMHTLYGPGGVVVVFTLGVVFAWVRLRTGAVTAPVLLHVSWNAVSYGLGVMSGSF